MLGGSFNPAHEGHLHISIQAIEKLGLGEVWWLVSPQNPLKPVEGMAPLAERVKSAREIAGQIPLIKISTIESDLGTQYTVDAIRALKKQYKKVDFVWLMGADNLVECHKWKDWEDIFSLVPIAIFDRAPYSEDALSSVAALRFKFSQINDRNIQVLWSKQPPVWTYLKIPLHPASSTEIRKESRN